MPSAVADSSTLIALVSIGHLDLLREFHGEILIPPAVWQEVVVEGSGRPGSLEVKEAWQTGWIKIIPPENRELVRLLERELDEGEAEAIALAIEVKADIIFLDEPEARRVAEFQGLSKAGVVGILLRAKLEGKIPSLRAEFDKLRHEHGFRLSEAIYRQVLQEVGEEDVESPHDC